MTSIDPTPAPEKVSVVAVVDVVPPVVLLLTTKLYGAVPPPAVKEPLPLVSPLQFSVTFAPVRVNAVGCVTLIVCVAVQPFEAVTVTLIDPAPAPVKSSVVAVVEVVPPVVLLFTTKLYGAVPPAAVNEPRPLVLPLQFRATSAPDKVNSGGDVILIVAVWVQPFESVT